MTGTVRSSNDRTKNLLTGVLRYRDTQDDGSGEIVPVHVRQSLPVRADASGEGGESADLALPERARQVSLRTRAGTASGAEPSEGPIDWEPWSREAVDAALAEGRPVFVDFTADCCLTCKVNERNAITAESVVETAERHDVAMLKADWTHQDELIRNELKRHGKAGVPMYLVYSATADASKSSKPSPRVLPEILSADMLVLAFEAAAESGE